MTLTTGTVIFGIGFLLVAAGLIMTVIFIVTARGKKKKIEEYLKERY